MFTCYYGLLCAVLVSVYLPSFFAIESFSSSFLVKPAAGWGAPYQLCFVAVHGACVVVQHLLARLCAHGHPDFCSQGVRTKRNKDLRPNPVKLGITSF